MTMDGPPKLLTKLFCLRHLGRLFLATSFDSSQRNAWSHPNTRPDLLLLPSSHGEARTMNCGVLRSLKPLAASPGKLIPRSTQLDQTLLSTAPWKPGLR